MLLALGRRVNSCHLFNGPKLVSFFGYFKETKREFLTL